jgi:hypothetical protein
MSERIFVRAEELGARYGVSPPGPQRSDPLLAA